MDKNRFRDFAIEVLAHITAIVLATCLLSWLLPGLGH